MSVAMGGMIVDSYRSNGCRGGGGGRKKGEAGDGSEEREGEMRENRTSLARVKVKVKLNVKFDRIDGGDAGVNFHLSPSSYSYPTTNQTQGEHPF